MSQSSSVSEPILPEVQVNLVRPKEPVVGRLTETWSCLKGKSNAVCRHVSVDVSGTPLAGNFVVGQSFGVIAPGTLDNRKPHAVRLYSIASPSCGEDGEGNVLSTCVKRLIEEYWPQKEGDPKDRHDLFLGVCSNFLCDINPGAEVVVTGPAGKRFILPVNPDEHDFIFIATGTGIAPFRGMVMELIEKGVSSRIDLVMGSPYTSDLMYDDLFTESAETHDNFHYHTAISRENPAGGCRGIYVHHLLERDIDVFGPLLENPRTLVYMCGLIGMQFGLYKLLAKLPYADQFMTVKDELAAVDPAEWDRAAMKRYIRPTARMMVEVY